MLNEYPRHREPGSGATNFFDVAVLYFWDMHAIVPLRKGSSRGPVR